VAQQKPAGEGGKTPVSDTPASDHLPDAKSAVLENKDTKAAIIEALLELAGERVWEDISISDVAHRAGISLSSFRDHFPSKGAVLDAFSRQIDKIVLEGTREDLIGEAAKDRLYDVLKRRLEALAPYRLGLEGVSEWLRRDPLAAAALYRSAVNSMRFMLEAAGMDSEGPVGAVKLQGLVFAWNRVLETWFEDHEPDMHETLNVLDHELERGSRFVARAEDLNRLVSPLRSLSRALFEPRRGGWRDRLWRGRDSGKDWEDRGSGI
jgi:AcrR family transcriptional regulator